MTTSETELVRQLTWRRHGTGWRLMLDRRRFGTVVPSSIPTMWRSAKSGARTSDMANLSWSKNAVLEEATRELEWEAHHQPAITPTKPQQRGLVFESSAPPLRYSEPAAISLPSSQ